MKFWTPTSATTKLPMALKTKLLAFLVLLLALLSFQWFLFVEHERRLLTEEAADRAGILAGTLAQLSREPLAGLQFTRLENQVESIKGERDVAYARIVNEGFRVMADSRKEEEGWTYSGSIVREPETRFTDGLLVARAPIEFLEKPIGMAEIAFSLEPMREKIRKNRAIFIESLLFQLIAGAAFSFFLNLQIIKPLRYLSLMLSAVPPETEAHEIAAPRFSSVEIRGMIASVNGMRSRLVDFRNEMVIKARFATMGKIAANLAHEIRNPLEAISGAVELIGTGLPRESEAQEYLAIIREEMRNLNDYLGEFLEFARTEPHAPLSNDLNELIQETLLLVNPLARKRGIAVTVRLSPDPLVCLADGNRLKRVFLNVLLNGLEACDAGGSVEVELDGREESCRVAVRDDGRGIPDEILGRVFDPYFTTKEKGSGIGLSLSKSIVEQHGGSIRISGRPGSGTEVVMTFPKEHPDADHPDRGR